MMNVGGDVVNHTASGSNSLAGIPIEVQQQQSQPPQSSHSSQSHTNAIQSKMSDILKRKAPPKRKSQTSSRSKSRNQDHHSEQSSSMMHELMNKAMNARMGESSLGKTKNQHFILKKLNGHRNIFLAGSSGRNTPSTSSSPLNAGASGSNSSGSSSRSRFGSSSKTSSFLASLNPARWGRTTSMSSHSTSKDSGHSSSNSGSGASSNALVNEHSSSSSLIAAGNREKARQWIREHAIAFNRKYDGENDLTSEPTVLVRLSSVIQKLSGNIDSCVEALNDLKQILLISDISPFEFNHSGLIRSMLKFMTSEQEIVHRDDRLRAFLNVFAGLPLGSIR